MEVMNTTLNATSAEHGDSNIRANVQPAEEMANLANLTATMALNMVSQHSFSGHQYQHQIIE
jgi:hypothetical protein